MAISIDIAGFQHQNPIPAASRVRDIVMSGFISGRDAGTGKLDETLAGQCRDMFANLKKIASAAGCEPEDIVKLNVYLRDTKDRAALNKEWNILFPEHSRRPARAVHPSTAVSDDVLVLCDFLGVASREIDTSEQHGNKK